MAARKSKKQASAKGSSIPAGVEPDLGLLQSLLSMIPDDEKLSLLSAMMGGPPDDVLAPIRKKPRTKAQLKIDRLVSQARAQDTTHAALPFLVQAEQAARKAVGKRFEAFVGRMSANPAGETYLDVKVELAQAYSAAGRREAALAELEDVYRLDGSDPLEARCLLLAGYFDLDRNDHAERLLNEDCPEPWAAWLFGQLLMALRRKSRGVGVDDQLKAAHRINPFVLSLLLGERMPDPTHPIVVETGEDSEAQEFAANFLPAWKNTPGAISWLREAAARLDLEIRPPSDQQPTSRRLTARDFDTMPPHRHSTWIAGLHDMGSCQMPGENGRQNHWLVFAFSPDDDLIGFDICTCAPTPRELWDGLVEFMLDERQPGRPATMLVHPPSLVKLLKKDATRAKIPLVPLEQADQLTAMLGQLTDRALGGAQGAESLDPQTIRNAPLDVDEVWEAAVVQLDRRLTVAGHSLRPWVALVMSRLSGMILWHELFTDSPAEGALANAVRMTIARPAMGPARRPRQVIVRDHDDLMSLASLSDEAGFACAAGHDLPLIADAVANLTRELLGGEPVVVLTKGAGTTPADLQRYYTAAAAYYQAQPWKHFAMDELIGLDRQEAPNRRRYALVMGQSGITMGLAIYERLKDIERMLESRSDRMALDSFSVMFGEVDSIAPADLDAIEQFGWPIATPEAYPDALRIHPGPHVETPTAEDLRFLTAALEAITWLVQHRNEKCTTVTVASTTLTAARLGWVGEVNEPQGQKVGK